VRAHIWTAEARSPARIRRRIARLHLSLDGICFVTGSIAPGRPSDANRSMAGEIAAVDRDSDRAIDLGYEDRVARALKGQEFRGKLHHISASCALLVPRGVGCDGAAATPPLRQPLDGLGEADALGLHQERDDVAMLAGREVV